MASKAKVYFFFDNVSVTLRNRTQLKGLIEHLFKKEEKQLDRLNYIFCSDESSNKCWTGVELSEILQEESLERLDVKINLWAWRHIIIGITKAHLEEIAPFFCKKFNRLEINAGCPQFRIFLERNYYHSQFECR